MAFGGRHLIGRYNNQIVVGGHGRIDVGEEARGGWSVWGGGVQSFEVTNSNDKKIYIKYTVAFGRPPIDNGSHNNQPKTGVRDGGEYREDVHRSGGTGVSAIPLFWGQ